MLEGNFHLAINFGCYSQINLQILCFLTEHGTRGRASLRVLLNSVVPPRLAISGLPCFFHTRIFAARSQHYIVNSPRTVELVRECARVWKSRIAPARGRDHVTGSVTFLPMSSSVSVSTV